MSTSKTILNVEDIKENRDLIRRILESEGYRVVEAVNAIEGIEKAQELMPDLILMDINLPDLDGFTAVTRIRSFMALRNVPIIAVTARNVSDDRQRAKAIGCDGYINKPVDFDELITEVDRHIEQGHKEVEAATKREHYLHEQSLNLIAELEQKIAEQKLAYERLKHLEQAKSDFISMVSHELRTPLTVVHSYTQMLQVMPSVISDATAKELLDGLMQGADRLKEITNDMVSVIRAELANENADFAPVSVRSVIKLVESEKQAAIDKRGLDLTVTIAKDLPMINGDLQQLQSALSRIMGNAIKYTPDKGKITIEAFRVEETNNNEKQTFVEIVVADTGIGIAIDKQNMIFDKFSTAIDTKLHSTSKTNFMGGGAGVGLTIARGIINAHNGRIWVESEGHDPESLPGSKFFILLPAM